MLIPLLGYNGAAVSRVITEVIMLTISFLYAKKHGYNIFNNELLVAFIRIFFASSLMLIFMLFFLKINIILVTIIAYILYLLVSLVIKSVDSYDIMLIREIVKIMKFR